MWGPGQFAPVAPPPSWRPWLGPMLFCRRVSGVRVVAPGNTKQIGPHTGVLTTMASHTQWLLAWQQESSARTMSKQMEMLKTAVLPLTTKILD